MNFDVPEGTTVQIFIGAAPLAPILNIPGMDPPPARLLETRRPQALSEALVLAMHPLGVGEQAHEVERRDVALFRIAEPGAEEGGHAEQPHGHFIRGDHGGIAREREGAVVM